MLVIGLIILSIILIIENNNLRKEIKDLKLKDILKVLFCPSCGFDFRNTNRDIDFCPNCGQNINSFSEPIVSYNQNTNIQVNEVKTIKKEKRTEKEIKNNFILITGAILIVLSAIVFLTSTWSITHNIIKTIVIVAMLAVFLAISYIADKYFNLKQTSKTFFYIALAYIPITLLSISMFSLFGNFLSLYGEGKYIYLAFSSVLVSYIYHLTSMKYKNKPIFIFNVMFQLLSIIFFLSIFTNKSNIIFCGLFAYSIIISLLYFKDKIYFDKNLHLRLSNILFLCLSIVLAMNNLIYILIDNINIFDLLYIILLFVNMYLILSKINKKENIYQYLYPIIIILIFTNLSCLFNNLIVRQLIVMISFIFICFYNLVKENKINLITYIEVLVGFSLFNFIWLANENLLDSYILLSIMSILNIINYIYSDKNKLFNCIILTLGIIITTISVITAFELSIIVLSIVSLILILLQMYLKGLDTTLKKSFKWIGVPIFILTSLFIIDGKVLSLILFTVFTLCSFTYFIKNNNNLYKILSYVYLNILLFDFFSLINLNYMEYVFPITTLLIIFIESLIKNIKNKASDIYLIISFIISNITLLSLNSLSGFIISLGINAYYIYYINYYKRNINYLCVPLLSMIPYIYFSNVMNIYNFNFMYIISIIILSILSYFVYIKKQNFYIIMLYVYTSFHIIGLDGNKYLNILLLIIGTIICYLIKNKKVKDIYKGLIYLLSLILYNFIIYDLKLDTTTTFDIGIYIVLTLLFTRTIFKKYSNNYKIWEYIICSLINLVTLFNCYNWSDRFLYIIFLVTVVFISYVFKFGPVFLVCLIAILLNTLFLIGIIPWWIYILIIGIILISFAIYNEIKDKNQEKKVNIKEHLDL